MIEIRILSDHAATVVPKIDTFRYTPSFLVFTNYLAISSSLLLFPVIVLLPIKINRGGCALPLMLFFLCAQLHTTLRFDVVVYFFIRLLDIIIVILKHPINFSFPGTTPNATFPVPSRI